MDNQDCLDLIEKVRGEDERGGGRKEEGGEGRREMKKLSD